MMSFAPPSYCWTDLISRMSFSLPPVSGITGHPRFHRRFSHPTNANNVPDNDYSSAARGIGALLVIHQIVETCFEARDFRIRSA